MTVDTLQESKVGEIKCGTVLLDHRVEKLVYVFQVDIDMRTCSMLPIEFEIVMCQLQHRNLPKGPPNVLSCVLQCKFNEVRHSLPLQT